MDFGPVRFHIARHFGFCYGVENAIEISYKALEENPEKKVYLISQMIHNQAVNDDLEKKGIHFIMDTEGNDLIDWNILTEDDVVIVPAFGTTLEVESRLKEIGLTIEKYNTTCPFVEKVWNRSEKLGTEDYTIIVHGKFRHEETRATFSRSQKYGASVIVRDLAEAKVLGSIITGKRNKDDFYKIFKGKYSEGFDVNKDFERIGVVNQTTMLASETQEIADYFKSVIQQKYGKEAGLHFADTSDTLCYATNDNQEATLQLLKLDADLAFVVGGYNSSNTSHLVELLGKKFQTYFINSANEIKSGHSINHFDVHDKKLITTKDYLPDKDTVNIILTSGASCPDTLLDEVLQRLLSFYENSKPVESVIESFDIVSPS